MTPNDLPNPTEFISAILPCALFLPKHTFEQATVLQCQLCWSVNISSKGHAVFRIRHAMGTRAIRVCMASCLHHLWRVFHSLFKKTPASLWSPREFKYQWLIILPRCLKSQDCNFWLYSDTDLSTQYFLNNALPETCIHILHFKNRLPKNWSMLSTTHLNCLERLVLPANRSGNRHKKGFWEKNLILQGRQEPGPPLAIVAKHSGILRRQLSHCRAKGEHCYTLVRAN